MAENGDPTQNPGSIYYLHPLDHSTMKMVTTPFNGVGFADWKRALIIGLVSKNKMAFVDGTLPKPTVTSSDYKAWERCNTMIIGWLMTSLERTLAKSVMYYTTAREIWLNLEDRFGQSSSTQLYHIHQDLNALTQGGMNVAEYYTKAKALWDELDNVDPLTICSCNGCTCDATKKNLKQLHNQRAINFLMHLDENFSQIRTNILMMDNLPSHSQIYRLLMQEQRHKEVHQITQTSTDSMAFQVDKRKYVHSNSSKNASFGKRNTYFCDHCKIPGHSIQRCFKIHGYPSSNSSSQSRRAANVTVTTSSAAPMEVDQSGFTPTQYYTLLKLLGKHEATSGTVAPDESFLAGPFDEKANTSW